MEISFIESDDRAIRKFKEALLENKHRELWQEIWTRHSEKEFEEFVNLKKFRLRINKLGRYIKNKDCVDFGCGNGSFALALIAMGARSVTGIDFGLNSIRYARKMARRRGLSSRVKFYVADILRNKLPGSRFDFAVSNGVFHHLNPIKIPLAVKEVARVLKKGGWFWYYMDGKDAISMDLFDASVEILDSVDTSFTENILRCMNVKRNKMVYLMDGLNATYFHSSYNRVIRDLSSCGFSNFRRLTGGTATDFDLDRIQKDRYGREKFGEGDLRILSQLARK
jgi:ubiquinone/menaquinone biosynthesis C-methylase UbiE